MATIAPRLIQASLSRDAWAEIEPRLRAAAVEARDVGFAYFDMDAEVAGGLLAAEAARLADLAGTAGDPVVLRWTDEQYAGLVFALETAAALYREARHEAEAGRMADLARWLRSFSVRRNYT